MSTRALTIAGFVTIAAAAVVVYAIGRANRAGLVPLRDVTDAIRSSTIGRLALALGWAWVGWHLLAR
jgi:Family of unknown function (DUF6186)